MGPARPQDRADLGGDLADRRGVAAGGIDRLAELREFSLFALADLDDQTRKSFECDECEKSRRDEIRGCGRESETPLIYPSGGPLYRCPVALDFSTKYLFGKILAVREGMLAPPPESIFWLRACQVVMEAAALAQQERMAKWRRKL